MVLIALHQEMGKTKKNSPAGENEGGLGVLGDFGIGFDIDCNASKLGCGEDGKWRKCSEECQGGSRRSAHISICSCHDVVLLNTNEFY